ncbi:class I SAM-dependent methyltransferase [Streptomyces sp. NPDC096132]|uniref:class I SAM-dependent methyltransferase n=1 Tax=Streptomyces sp. NPDC096132 TaxID=3366075 RepID=UPI00381EA3E9
MTSLDVRDFYDSLADDYHLMFRDWWASAQDEAATVDALLRSLGVEPPAAILDCTCGIGTQAVPLCTHGYQVVGSDLSERAVARAAAEARAHGIRLPLLVADVREVADAVDRRFDAVISFDNALPHLVTDDGLLRALRSIRRTLTPGGVFLASTRDYDALLADRVRGVTPVLLERDGVRVIAGQAWEWADDRRTMKIHLFLMREEQSGWTTDMRSTVYRALLREEFTRALADSGFGEVRWYSEADSGYYQPVVAARAV